MIKKIQHYLLVNHSLLWNTCAIPAALSIIIINILFIALGYKLGHIDFKNPYESVTNTNTNYVFVFIAGLLTVVIWLYHYQKYNAFKSFYPKTTFNFYKEWSIIFILMAGIWCYTLSFDLGITLKIRTYATQTENNNAHALLDKVEILLPSNLSYYSNKTNSQPDSVSHTTYSLLNYSSYSGNDETITLLKAEDSMAIHKLMVDFLALQKKYHLPHSLTLHQWYGFVYHPPLYSITENELIHRSQEDANDNSHPFVSFEALQQANFEISVAYKDSNYPYVLCVFLCVTTLLSMLLLCFRITQIQVVLTTAITFLIGLLTGAFILFDSPLIRHNFGFQVAYLILLGGFITLFLLIHKYNNKNKGRFSPHLTCVYLLLAPFIPFSIYYGGFLLFCIFAGRTSLYSFMDKHPLAELCTFFILAHIAVYFALHCIKKWKALSE